MQTLFVNKCLYISDIYPPGLHCSFILSCSTPFGPIEGAKCLHTTVYMANVDTKLYIWGLLWPESGIQSGPYMSPNVTLTLSDVTPSFSSPCRPHISLIFI